MNYRDRLVLRGEARQVVADREAASINALRPNRHLGQRWPDLLGQLRREGIVGAPISLAQHAAEVTAHFEKTPAYNAHVAVYSDQVPRPPADLAATSAYGSYRLEQSIRAPHILAAALDADVLDLVGGYLGCMPSIYSINTFWTFPGQGAGYGTHGWHRDEDDHRFLAMFIYWTDVSPGDGEFQFIPTTHDNAQNGGQDYGDGAEYERRFGAAIKSITGPPGAAFIADAYGMHRGRPRRSAPRLVTWVRYGLAAGPIGAPPNWGYLIDRMEPVRVDVQLNDEQKFICRLIIKGAA